MPDLVTHTFAAWLLARPERWRKVRLFFFVGAILPDIISRPIYILQPRWQGYTVALHTPLFALLCALLLAEFMAPALRCAARIAISAGILLHFVLDLMQSHLGAGYYWFFPFSWRSFELGWFWPETTVSWIPLWLGLMAAAEAMLWWRRSRHSSGV
ncbi:MAG TPA: metal-dependent hydrolase [bacterium]|nr:metal-dependent hydrolase [bacterium]HQG44306.1 metal-dependent hydrolase [bacterium]HQI49949.1 metal-dependent hydrolase [bacterium]HQJ63643.1 metal-dependent hydrolase [bacterium]